MSEKIELQNHFAKKSICFGCGPANEKGLKINSVAVEGEDVVTCEWKPSSHHEAFPGMLNGGIIGALLDCHSNWAAAYFIMKKNGEKQPPCTVTAFFNVSLRRPTPSKSKVFLKAWVKEFPKEDRALIQAELWSEEKLCATCEGLFVAVKEGHPAYHRW